VETTQAKIGQVIAATLRPTIIIVHPLPENALHNTLHRFEVEGRGASINVMSSIQGGLADSLSTIRDTYGKDVALVIHDVRNRSAPQRLAGWQHLDVLRSEGTVVQIKERLSHELETLSKAGRITESAYRQAAGLAPEPTRDRLDVGRGGEDQRGDTSRSEGIATSGRAAVGYDAAQEALAGQSASRLEMMQALKEQGYAVRELSQVKGGFEGQVLLVGKEDVAIKLGASVAVLVNGQTRDRTGLVVGDLVRIERADAGRGLER
jgi:hypothetical protein